MLSGGVAFIAPQFGAPIDTWLFYGLLALLFSSIWPYKSWQWVVWLCLPIVLLFCFDIIITGTKIGLLRDVPILAKVLPAACLGAFLGTKLSVRRIANLLAPSQVSRRRVSNNGKGAHGVSVPSKPAPSISGNKVISSSHEGSTHAPAVEPTKSVQDPNAPLIKAAQVGDLESIRRLVADGADVNARSGDQWTPMMIAAQDGDALMVKALFDSGAMTDASSNRGHTALMLAVIEGHVEVVRVLLEHGAQVNARSAIGWTALRFAISMNETEIIRLLLEAGAEVNISDDEGRTALMQAAEENMLDSLKALLEAGADPYIKDHKEQTALSLARKRGHSKAIKLLKEAEGGVPADAPANILYDDSYFYLLKEELEEGLNTQQTENRAARLLRELQEHINAIKKERSLTPSVLSHKLLLTLPEAAALAGLPRQHLLEAIEGGRLKAQLLEHAWRIRRTDLDDYVSRLR